MLLTHPNANEAKEYATMRHATTIPENLPLPTSSDVLTEVCRTGARQMLAQAIEAEVAAYLDARSELRDEAGRLQVVRNGHLPQRTILTGIGAVEVKQPRVQDRRPAAERERFSSAILPPYLRKTKSMEELIPWLYLKGVSTGDFSEALAALVGPQAKGLSANTVTRLKAVWQQEYEAWNKRSLADKRYVYVWADGVYFNIRLEDDRQCILVLMGATADGKKEVIALTDGYRESGGVVEGLAPGLQGTGPDDGSAAGDRRRQPRLLESPAEGLSHDSGATLLGAQDGQRARQDGQGSTAQGEGHDSRHLASGDEGSGGESPRSLRGNLRGEVPEGDGLPAQGPRDIVGLL